MINRFNDFKKTFNEDNNENLSREEKIEAIISYNKENGIDSDADKDDIFKLDDNQLDKYYSNIFGEYLTEGSTVSSPGSGTAVGGGAEGSFVSSNGVSMYGGDSGSAFATNSSVSGMGNIVSAQPSSKPGDVRGSTKGSGDIGSRGGVYSKIPVGKRKKQKTKRSKIASDIDKLYTTNYKESTNNGKIIQSWNTFNEEFDLKKIFKKKEETKEIEKTPTDFKSIYPLTKDSSERDKQLDSILQYMNSQDNGTSVSETDIYKWSDEKIENVYNDIKKSYSKVDESILGNVARLRTGSRPETKNKLMGRMDDDNYAYEIFESMKEDFLKYNKDLNKVKMMSDHHMTYVMGKYDVIKNSPSSGNVDLENGKTLITITYIPSEILLKPNSVEKMFGVNSGVKLAKGYIKIEKTVKNPNYRPGFSPKWNEVLSPTEKEWVRSIDRTEERFKITYDLAKEICDYFRKEYINKYPQLKDAKYKNSMSISEIEKGNKPTLDYVHAFDKNNNEIVYPYYDLKDKKKIEEFIKNNIVIKGRNNERYHITYFTLPSESEDVINYNIKNMSSEDVDKQNMERVYSFKK